MPEIKASGDTVIFKEWIEEEELAEFAVQKKTREYEDGGYQEATQKRVVSNGSEVQRGQKSSWT